MVQPKTQPEFQRFTDTKGLLFYFFYIIFTLFYKTVASCGTCPSGSCPDYYKDFQLRATGARYLLSTGLLVACALPSAARRSLGAVRSVPPQERLLPEIGAAPLVLHRFLVCEHVGTPHTKVPGIFAGFLGGWALQSLPGCCSPVLATSGSSRSHPFDVLYKIDLHEILCLFILL